MDPIQQRTETPAKSRGIPLMRIGGIRVWLDYSWFFIFLLVLLSLALGYFPQSAPDVGAASHWIAGLIAALLFFLSILAHELAHSWVALRAGIPVPEIRLFLFGGVSRMDKEPPSPQVELRVALAGPAMSFALAALCGILASLASGTPWMTATILTYLAWINMALGVFNLLPGYPLDGGRVLRAIVWWKTGSLRHATKIASNAGKTLAIALMILGGLQILAGALVAGVWLILIAMLLRSLAQREYADLLLHRSLADVDVERVMVPRNQIVSVPPDLPIRDLVNDYFLGHGYRGFPVMEDGRAVGIVSAEDVKHTKREKWSECVVSDVMRPVEPRLQIGPQDSLLEALKRFSGDRGRLLVMSDGQLLGLLSTSALTRFVELRGLLKAS